MELKKWRKILDQARVKEKMFQATIIQEEEQYQKLVKKQKGYQQAQVIFQEIGSQIQNNVQARISSIVTKCLFSIFGDDSYEFKMTFEKKRGKTEARLILIRNEQEIDPTSVGGGVLDVICFALRIAVLLLSSPPKRRLLVLDEPFRFLSRNYQPAIQSLLVELSNELGIQIIQVTHSDLLVAGKVIPL